MCMCECVGVGILCGVCLNECWYVASVVCVRVCLWCVVWVF